MAGSTEFEDYLVGQLEAATGVVRAKRMFGGVGLYVDEVFCAIIAPEFGALYLKVDDTNRARYEQEGMEPLRLSKGALSYWTVPEHVVEDPDLLREWTLEARNVALATSAKKKRGAPARVRR